MVVDAACLGNGGVRPDRRYVHDVERDGADAGLPARGYDNGHEEPARGGGVLHQPERGQAAWPRREAGLVLKHPGFCVDVVQLDFPRPVTSTV